MNDEVDLRASAVAAPTGVGHKDGHVAGGLGMDFTQVVLGEDVYMSVLLLLQLHSCNIVRRTNDM